MSAAARLVPCILYSTYNSYCIDAQFCERHIKHLLYGGGFVNICRKCDKEARIRFMSHHAHHTATTTAMVMNETTSTVVAIVVALQCTHTYHPATTMATVVAATMTA